MRTGFRSRITLVLRNWRWWRPLASCMPVLSPNGFFWKADPGCIPYTVANGGLSLWAKTKTFTAKTDSGWDLVLNVSMLLAKMTPMSISKVTSLVQTVRHLTTTGFLMLTILASPRMVTSLPQMLHMREGTRCPLPWTENPISLWSMCVRMDLNCKSQQRSSCTVTRRPGWEKSPIASLPLTDTIIVREMTTATLKAHLSAHWRAILRKR